MNLFSESRLDNFVFQSVISSLAFLDCTNNFNFKVLPILTHFSMLPLYIKSSFAGFNKLAALGSCRLPMASSMSANNEL